MQPNQVPKRSVPSSELFNKTPTDNPESQQEQWLPAVPLVGEVLQALAPSTWKLHPCTCTSIRKLKVFLLSSLNIPKSPATDWGLSLTERKRAFHLPDGFRSPHQGSSHSLPAPSQTGQLFKQLSVSFLSFQLFLLREAQVILIIKFNLLIVFLEVLRNPRLTTLATELQKKVTTSSIPADLCKAESLTPSWREIWCLPLDRCLVHPAISSHRFIRHCSWHTRHLQCRPSSCVYTCQKSTEENQKQVLMKTNCLDKQQLFFLSSPSSTFFFPSQVLLSNSTFLKTKGAKVG